MPIFKIDILGSQIEINYEEAEKEKLIMLIEKFKKRLDEFSSNGKRNNNAIIFLSALKVEDELEEQKELLSKNLEIKDNLSKQSKIIFNLNEEIILLKNEINDLNSKNIISSNENILIFEKIQNLEKLIQKIKTKISKEIN